MSGIDDISHSIGRLESKVDQLLEAHDKFDEKFDRHDDRLKSLEGHKSYVLGIVAAVSLLFTVVIEYAKAKLFG